MMVGTEEDDDMALLRERKRGMVTLKAEARLQCGGLGNDAETHTPKAFMQTAGLAGYRI